MPEIGASTTFTLQITDLASTLWVARFEAVEAVSAPFEVELLITSDDKDIALASVVGKTAALTLESDGSEPRYIHGVISRFRYAEVGKRLTVYRATMVPTLWRLRHRHDSRIFQDKTVPDILKEVLDGGGVSDVRSALTGSYEPRAYCVQYRESDFAFLSRLMEEEGIYYFFEHSADKHVLVLADGPSASAPIASATLSYRGALGAMAHGESVSRFSSAEEVRPGKVTLNDWNFEKPGLSLLGSSTASLDSDLEVYDYPGEFDAPDHGSAYAQVRLEEWQARRATADGESGVIRMTPGYLFTLAEHPRDADNQEHFITSVRHRGEQAQFGESGGGAPSYSNTFQAIPSSVPFRPERVTPRPTVRGAQTAIVTGPGGEEIYTDKHGRVKVHFHWDRAGKKDDSSSCWIRVSQLWAGAGWGGMWIPRVGHEVIVDFLEGDPDRPIIIGRVYHGTNVPPYALPGEKTKSTIKSDSSKGGSGFNELRFEDKKGAEEVFLHAQKDWDIVVEHDKSQRVGHDETLSIGHNRTKQVNNDQEEKIGGNKSISVGGSHMETIGAVESITVGGASAHTIGGALAETVGGAKAMTIGASLTETVAGSMSVRVGGSVTHNVGGSINESVGGDVSINVGGDQKVSVAKGEVTTIGQDQKTSVAKTVEVAVGEKYELKVGEGKVTVLKNGEITIEGKDITIKGSGSIKIKGAKLEVESDGSVDVKAGGAVKIKGSAVEVN